MNTSRQFDMMMCSVCSQLCLMVGLFQRSTLDYKRSVTFSLKAEVIVVTSRGTLYFGFYSHVKATRVSLTWMFVAITLN